MTEACSLAERGEGAYDHARRGARPPATVGACGQISPSMNVRSMLNRTRPPQLLLVLGVTSATLILASGCFGEQPTDRSFLTQEPCAAPCWHGLQPDEATNVEAVVSLLRQLPFVKPDSVQLSDFKFPGIPPITGTMVYYDCPSYGVSPCGDITLSQGKVKEIRTVVKYDLPLSLLLTRYGEPTYVSYGNFGVDVPACAIFFNWSDQRITAELIDKSRYCSGYGQKQDGSDLDTAALKINVLHYAAQDWEIVGNRKK